jgi:glutamine amidotransferase
MVSVAIVDYGVGNLRSIKRALERTGATSIITSSSSDIKRADAIVLPGVGSFKSATQNLGPMLQSLHEAIEGGRPVLGICLGLQLFFEWSEEGGVKGLGLVEGFVDRLPSTVKVPHMGWNSINVRAWSPIIDGIPNGAYMYFVHSYKVNPKRSDVVIATTTYGCDFPSIIEAKPVILGTQFHPEKSGSYGLAILKNFVKLVKQ